MTEIKFWLLIKLCKKLSISLKHFIFLNFRRHSNRMHRWVQVVTVRKWWPLHSQMAWLGSSWKWSKTHRMWLFKNVVLRIWLHKRHWRKLWWSISTHLQHGRTKTFLFGWKRRAIISICVRSTSTQAFG